jgi:GABA(A) receptor-associated protein
MDFSLQTAKSFLKNSQKKVFKPKSFKEKHSLEKRVSESAKIMEKYPNRIPVICQKIHSAHDIPDIDRVKYLVPNDLNMGQFLYIIRKRIKIEPEKAIYIFVNDKIVAGTQIIMDIYENNKDKDGFLYIYYTGETTFG